MTFRPVPFYPRNMPVKHFQTEISILFGQKVKSEKHRVVLLKSIFVLLVIEYVRDTVRDGSD